MGKFDLNSVRLWRNIHSIPWPPISGYEFHSLDASSDLYWTKIFALQNGIATFLCSTRA